MTSTTRNTDTRVAETIVAMLEDPSRFWGNVHVRNLDLRQHPAWHLHGLTFERTCADGLTENYQIVSEPESVFRERMEQTPIGQPCPEDVRFRLTAKFRHPGMPRTVWRLRIEHYGSDQRGRTDWERLLDGSAKCDHFVADKHGGFYRPCQPGFEQCRTVTGMEFDLPPGLVCAFLGDQVAASA